MRMSELGRSPFNVNYGSTLTARVVAFNFYGHSDPSNSASTTLVWEKDKVEEPVKKDHNIWTWIGIGIAIGFLLIALIFGILMCCCHERILACFARCKRDEKQPAATQQTHVMRRRKA